jgi:2-phospho-L-lactate/phosphoenolpyruvate guanylyltransferase
MTAGWTALIPYAPAGMRKTRLAGLLDSRARDALADTMLDHLLDVLRASPLIDDVHLLARTPRADTGWIDDKGLALNEALALAQASLPLPLLILFADLPLAGPEDVEALTRLAQRHGAALSPDRHGAGTNAIALATAQPFRFAFGPGSFAAHAAQLGTKAILHDRPGLMVDVDTPDDLAFVAGHGFRLAA